MTIKQMWRKVWGDPEPNHIVEMLKLTLANQEATQEKVFEAIGKIAEASQKQADVLGQYLKLFQPASEGDQPERWEYQPNKLTLEEMVLHGLPKDANEKQQAEWILDHLNKIEN